MKKIFLSTIVLAALTLGANLYAQQVNTLYFLENAPQRHLINPAFQPVSRVYVGFTPLSYMSISLGNNAFALSDLIYKKNGQYVTALYPGESGRLNKRLRNDLLIRADADLSLLNFGFRIRKNGYFHFSVTERLQTSFGVTKGLYEVFYTELADANGRVVDLSKFSNRATLYTEFAAGYGHRINEKWAVGGKLKILLGHGYMAMDVDSTSFTMHPDHLHAGMKGMVYSAIPFSANVPEVMSPEDLKSIGKYFDFSNILSGLKPAGIGAAVDLGATYKPIPQLQVAFSVTDLGFIRWNNIQRFEATAESTHLGSFVSYTEITDKDAANYKATENTIVDTIANFLSSFILDELHLEQKSAKKVTSMVNAKMHIGVDANFWKNRVGVGLYSCTTFRGNKVSEELTLGAAIRPVNWFNFALSYSFINGRWNSLGCGLSMMPYDGVHILLMTDYIPFTYASLKDKKTNILFPYRMRQLNLALGFSIVVGTNPKKEKVTAPDLETKPEEGTKTEDETKTETESKE